MSLSVAAIVTVSVAAFVVIVTLLPAARFKVSVEALAATLSSPETATVLNAF